MLPNNSAHLIQNLDANLRDVLKQPTIDNIRSCFSALQQCHLRRLEDEKIIADDSLYIPAILLLRQFNRFQNPSTFDELLRQFIPIFELMPISTKKVLDDFLCIISIILTKRIMTTHDEVQQDLFVRFFRAFCLSLKRNPNLFYRDFLGNFNTNLPIIGHYLSCLLQLYEKINMLDYRLTIIDTIWSLISTNENEHRLLTGQIFACFLPGILKTLAQDIGSIHQRLIQANLLLLSYILRLTVCLSPVNTMEMNAEVRHLVVERNEQWLEIVDTHLAPLLQRSTKDYANHESLDVRQALGVLMLTVLCFCSTWLKISANMALKTMLVLVASTKTPDEKESIMKILLEKLFKLPMKSIPSFSSEHGLSLLGYKNELFNEILTSSTLTLSDQLLIECQTDLFRLLDQQQVSSSSTFLDRRWRLQLFLGYYQFLYLHIDFLLNMETFLSQFLHFLLNTLDFETLIRTNLNLLNGTSLPNDNKTVFDGKEYQSVYKHFQPDVHNELRQIIEVFVSSHPTFPNYIFEQINQKKLTEETNLKLFYLLSITFEQIQFEEYPLLLSFLTQLICDDNHRKHIRKRKKEEPVSIRNVTTFYLLQCLRPLTSIDQTEYLIDYIPLLLLCHASKYTVLHQTSLLCLSSLSTNISSFLVTQAEYIIDSSLRKLQTSSYDGYLILIEFIRLGQKQVINLPLMTHVIEQLLLELSCLPPIECIELTFEFLHVFCRQVSDIVERKTSKAKSISPPRPSFVELALSFRQQQIPTEETAEENEKKDEHPWHRMLVSIIDVFQHYISHGNPHVRSYVLDAFPSLAELLSSIDENLFLPLVHKLWPGLIHRLYDTDVNIRLRCLSTIECLCQICSDFVDRRIRQDILPILLQQLENNRLISSSNTLEYRYLKSLLSNIGSIVNAISVTVEDVEKLVLILFHYLQIEPLAPNAFEQLLLLSKKYSDIIWLKLSLHEQNEFRKGYFPRMKVYKPEPMLTIDPKWQVNLLDC